LTTLRSFINNVLKYQYKMETCKACMYVCTLLGRANCNSKLSIKLTVQVKCEYEIQHKVKLV